MDLKTDIKHFQFLTKYAEPGVHYNPEEHINKLLGHESQAAYSAVALSPHITDEHINKIISFPRFYSANARLAKNPALKPHQLQQFLDSEDDDVVQNALENPNVTSDHLQHIVDKSQYYNFHTNASVATHPKVTHEQVMKLLRDNSSSILHKHIIKYSPRIGPADLHEIITNDRYGSIAKDEAVDHPLISDESLQHATQSQNYMLRAKAKEALENRKK